MERVFSPILRQRFVGFQPPKKKDCERSHLFEIGISCNFSSGLVSSIRDLFFCKPSLEAKGSYFCSLQESNNAIILVSQYWVRRARIAGKLFPYLPPQCANRDGQWRNFLLTRPLQTAFESFLDFLS